MDTFYFISQNQVWISFAQFELSYGGEGSAGVAQARHIYDRSNKALRQAEEKEARLLLLESWQEFEVR